MKAQLPVIAIASVLGLSAGYVGHAQDSADGRHPQDSADGRHPVATGSTWYIDDADCAVDAGWDGGISLWLTRHHDHRDLGLYSAGMTGIRNKAVIQVSFGVDERPATKQGYPALGLIDPNQHGYVITSDDALLARLAAATSFQLYRGGKELLSLDAGGMRAALAAMDTCTANLPPSNDGNDVLGNKAVDAAVEAAVAAASAAEEAANTATAAKPK